MKNEDLHYLDRICQNFSKVIEFTRGISYSDFLDNEEKQDAVIRNIAISGVATKKLSQGLMVRFHHVPWRAIAGMSDKLVNDFFGVDLEIVWETATVDIPALLPEIRVIIEELKEDS